MGWKVEKTPGATWTRVLIDGELDLYEAPGFTHEMLLLLEKGERMMVFEVEALSYLDSTGVGSIIRILKAAREKGAQVRWRGISGMPRRVLAMSNILPLLQEERVGNR
jgi:anti-sigma B factor antagonist